MDPHCNRRRRRHCGDRLERLPEAPQLAAPGHVRRRVRPNRRRRTSRREAEADLAEREKRHQEFELKPLEPQARERYIERWRQTQEQFVDDPDRAVGQADGLIQEVMRERSYPVEDFDQRADDLSVDHPDVISNYRAAHATAIANERGKATTEDLRNAVIHYRALFSEVLEAEPAEAR